MIHKNNSTRKLKLAPVYGIRVGYYRVFPQCHYLPDAGKSRDHKQEVNFLG